jgi:hypothetical protein
LNLISVEENIKGKGSEIPFDPAIPSEGSLEVQEQGKEAPNWQGAKEQRLSN